MQPEPITDYTSVSLRGVINAARARVLWRDGTLRVYTPDGLLHTLVCPKPVRQPGFLRTWSVTTSKGELTLKGRCMTCGGRRWWGLYAMPAGMLWGAA